MMDEDLSKKKALILRIASGLALAGSLAALAIAPAFEASVNLAAEYGAPNPISGYAQFSGRLRLDGRVSLIAKLSGGDRLSKARSALEGSLSRSIAKAGPEELSGRLEDSLPWCAKMREGLAKSLEASLGGSWRAHAEPACSLAPSGPPTQ